MSDAPTVTDEEFDAAMARFDALDKMRKSAAKAFNKIKKKMEPFKDILQRAIIQRNLPQLVTPQGTILKPRQQIDCRPTKRKILEDEDIPDDVKEHIITTNSVVVTRFSRSYAKE